MTVYQRATSHLGAAHMRRRFAVLTAATLLLALAVSVFAPAATASALDTAAARADLTSAKALVALPQSRVSPDGLGTEEIETPWGSGHIVPGDWAGGNTITVGNASAGYMTLKLDVVLVNSPTELTKDHWQWVLAYTRISGCFNAFGIAATQTVAHTYAQNDYYQERSLTSNIARSDFGGVGCPRSTYYSPFTRTGYFSGMWQAHKINQVTITPFAANSGSGVGSPITWTRTWELAEDGPGWEPQDVRNGWLDGNVIVTGNDTIGYTEVALHVVRAPDYATSGESFIVADLLSGCFLTDTRHRVMFGAWAERPWEASSTFYLNYFHFGGPGCPRSQAILPFRLTDFELYTLHASGALPPGQIDGPLSATFREWRLDHVVTEPDIPPDAVRVRAIEVTQAIQTWDNSVTLVADKRTVARVFLEVEDPSLVGRVSGTLVASLDGVPLGGTPAYLVSPGGAITPVPDASIPAVRGDISASLNFRLPDAWVQPGELEITFQPAEGEVMCGAAVGSTSVDCAVTVTIVEVPEVSVTFLGVDHISASNYHVTSDATLREQDLRVYSLMPTPWHSTPPRTIQSAILLREITQRNGEVKAPGIPEAKSAVEAYWGEATRDGCAGDCSRMFHGIAQGMSGGLGALPGATAASGTSDVNGRWSMGDGRNTVVHETGHNLGSDHSFNINTEKKYSSYYKSDRHVDGCKAAQHDLDSEAYPFHGDISYEDRTRVGAAILGERGDPGVEPWGLDARSGSLYAHPELTVMDPYEIGDVMGYCKIKHPNDRWVSVTNWNRWLTALQESAGSDVGDSSGDGAVAPERILVSGLVSGSGDDAAVTFSPVLALGAGPVDESEGPFVLEARRGNSVVGSFPFDVDDAAICHDIVTGEEFVSEDRSFSVAIPTDPAGDYTEFRVVRDGEILGSMSSAERAPEVAIVSPRTGSVNGAEDLLIRWSIDAEGAATVYSTVRYSSDNGETWETIRLQTTATEIRVPRSQLTGSANARVQVKVSQGTKTDIATSAPFTVADTKPYVVDLGSVDAPEVMSGAQTVWQEAFVADNEDGILDGDAITWTSHVDGVIGTGRYLIRDASDFTPGSHIVTMTAKDSIGNTVSQTIVLYVAEEPVYEYVEAPLSDADYFALVDELIRRGGYHPGTKNPLAAAYSQTSKEHLRGRTDKACDALDRADSLIDSREGQHNGLTATQASELREVTRLLGVSIGCAIE